MSKTEIRLSKADTFYRWHTFQAGKPGIIEVRGARDGVLSRIVATLAEWRRRVKDRQELARLGERALQDMGLSRTDVQREIGKPFWRP